MTTSNLVKRIRKLLFNASCARRLDIERQNVSSELRHSVTYVINWVTRLRDAGLLDVGRTEIPRSHTNLQPVRISLKMNTACNVVRDQAILETSVLDVCGLQQFVDHSVTRLITRP